MKYQKPPHTTQSRFWPQTHILHYSGLMLSMLITAAVGWHLAGASHAESSMPTPNNPVVASVISSNQVEIRWITASGSVNHYSIQRKSGGGTSAGTSTQTAVIDTVSAGDYQYTIYAVNSSGTETPVGSTDVTVTGASQTASAPVTVAESLPAAGSSTLQITGSSAVNTQPQRGTVTLATVIPAGNTATYLIDGKPTAAQADTTFLADGTHTVAALLTAPNGQVTTREQTFIIDNHQSALRNLILRFGAPVIITGLIVVSLSLLGMIAYAVRFLHGMFSGKMPPPPNLSSTQLPTILPPAPFL